MVRPSSDTQTQSVFAGGAATLALTAAHHLYGGILYRTPWRIHGAVVATAFMIPLWLLAVAYRRAPATRLGGRAGAALAVLTFIVPVFLVGGFEGGYNHLLKNVLFFGGAPSSLLLALFPPPMYHMPDDALFEISGVAQVIAAAWTAAATIRFLPALRNAGGGRRRGGRRIAPGTALPPHRLVAVDGTVVPIPDEGAIVHLQLRRFAGCSVCNLHLRSVTRRHHEIAAAGVREVVVFHSTARELSAYAADLPFPVVADPDKRLYAELGAEAGVRAVLDPRAWPTIVRALARSVVAVARGTERPPALRPHGGRYGLPADFLIASDGRVMACKYGRHADDQWSVDELLALLPRRAAARVSSLEESHAGHC